MSTDYERVERWLAAIENDGVNLTPWEETFVADMRTLLDSDADLTPAQIRTIEKIYADRTP